MSKYGVWMLDKLVVKYCSRGGSSRGMRVFLQENLPAIKAESPSLAIEEVQRPWRHPMLVALYRNGRSKPVCVKNLKPREIEEHLMWLRNSHGRGQEYQVVRSRHLSRNPSVQGQWSVDTFAHVLNRETQRRAAATDRMLNY